MGVEKEGTKNGGSFFHLFDWTSKSRKKLFASKSDLPESLKHERKANHNVARHPYLVDEDESGVGEYVRGSCDHSYASSVTSDDTCGARAPNVVARLMGLDSLPSSGFSDPYSTPYFDTRSLQDSQFLYSGKLVEKVEGTSSNFVEPKPQKAITRPIEKFQREVLPPKSAKSIPVTHHKLLSPIKNPGFVPSNNAAYIMEAAARIIEPGSSQAKAKTHMAATSIVSLRVKDVRDKLDSSQKAPLIATSSVAFRTRELKEKRDISQRTSRVSERSQRSTAESNAAKCLKGQSLNRSWNGTAETSVKSPTHAEEDSCLKNKGKSVSLAETSVKSPTHAEEDSNLKNKGKSVSLAIQAKVNVQRREGLSSTGGRNLMGQKEHLDSKSNQPLPKANAQKNLHRKSSGQNSSNVLRQNNLKQNHSNDNNDKLVPSKPLVSNSQGRKVTSGDSPYGRHRSSSSKSTAKSKVGSRKSAVEVTDSENEILYTSTNSFPRKKRTTDKDWNDRVVDNLFIDKTPKSVKSNLSSNKQYGWSEEVKKKDMDVVSFTFTTPLTRNSNPGSETPRQDGKNTNDLSLDQRIKRVLLDADNTRSPIGYNVIGGDALGILLEQKLRELSQLTSGVETSSITAPKSNDQVTNFNIVNLNPRLEQKKDQDMSFTESLSGSRGSDMSFTNLPESSLKHKSWGDEMEPLSFNCRQPSPISVLEPSFSIESCESSMSTEVTSTEGSKIFSSLQAQEIHGFNFSRKFYPTECDAELSDSASSTSTRTTMKKQNSTFSAMKFGRSSSTWELDYVKEILCNVELMYMDFSIGRTREVVNTHLFNQLESRKGGFKIDDESRIERKVIFDCVSECLDLRCRSYVGGGYKMWIKGFDMVRRKDWLAKDVYKEILGWKGMRDSMVDELVDKDMSSQYGKWLDLDYEIDAYDFGEEVADQIFNSLVDDVVYEMLQF
ncbi:GPI-anchored adhesin protein [Trifolium repens]|nr:GPI-anchored adhesin protein [Trifolium repens]